MDVKRFQTKDLRSIVQSVLHRAKDHELEALETAEPLQLYALIHCQAHDLLQVRRVEERAWREHDKPLSYPS